MANYYDILGITADEKRLPEEEFEKVLKKKYKAMALQYHPDKQVGKSDEEKQKAEETFKEVNEAYSVLSDRNKKMEYDMYGTVGNSGSGFGGMGDIQDLINNMHMHFGGFGQQQQATVVGSDIRVSVECTPFDIYKGATKKMRYKRMVPCKDCNGSGSADGKTAQCQHCHGTGVETKVERNAWMQSVIQTTCSHCGGTGFSIASKCSKCGGSGLVSESETIEITIPTDTRNGSYITIPGKGNYPSNNSGQPGNLHVIFKIKNDGLFVMYENTSHLISKTKVGVLDCVTGCDKNISCIDGTLTKIHIPAGAKDGTQIVVKGKGMPIGNNLFGDMYVYVEQVMPKTLNDNEKQKIEELKKMKHFKV